MTGTATLVTDAPDLEEWRSDVRSLIGIRRWDKDGIESSEKVHAGESFFITPDERRRNEKKVRAEINNPFRNGSFIRMSAVEGEPDNDEIAGNANAMPQDQLEALCDAPGGGGFKKFEAGVKRIDSPVTLRRMLTYLTANGDAGPKRVEVVRARLRQVDTNPQKGDTIGHEPDIRDAPTQLRGPATPVRSARSSSPTTGGPRQYPGIDDAL